MISTSRSNKTSAVSGKFSYWILDFYSPSAQALYSIRVSERGIDTHESPAYGFENLPKEFSWVDSTEAMNEAEKAGGRIFREQNLGWTVEAKLIWNLENSTLEWRVYYDARLTEKHLCVVLDAQTGLYLEHSISPEGYLHQMYIDSDEGIFSPIIFLPILFLILLSAFLILRSTKS